MADSRQN